MSNDGKQFVGIDLHRRRSVILHVTESGQRLKPVRILSDPERLAAVLARAGQAPEVVLQATCGWYRAADAPAELGTEAHLAHPLGGEGVRVPVGEERRTRHGGPG